MRRLKLRLTLVVLCSWLVPLSVSAALIPEQTEAIDALFSTYESPGSPGCAIGIIQDGDFAYRRGYGLANLEYAIPIDPGTVFRTGSVGKQFTATAIALLAESGAISLDDALSTYFPEFPGWARQVTIRQLIHHTSGIRDYLQLAFLAGKSDDADYYTDAWVLRLLARQQETNFPPGSQHLYSNSGYLLLAHLVERVTGQTLRDYARANIFEPLGMRSSHFHDDHNEIVPRRASGYAPDGDGYRISMTTLDMVGDGGVFTSVDELLAWDQNFYTNRLGRGGPGLIELITTPGQLNDGSVLDYAFGLGIEDFRGHKLISHGGAFVGFRAEVMRFPELQTGIIVLCNRADAEPEHLAREVAGVVLAEVLEPGPDPLASMPRAEVHPLTESELQAYTGDYWEHGEAFAAETRVIDGKLWAVHSPTRKNELVPTGPDRFEMVGLPAEVYVDFVFRDGQLAEVRRFINGEARGVFVPFRRRETTAKELQEYVGVFHSRELGVSYGLQVEDDKLWFRIDQGEPHELTAMFDETFENPDYGAFTFDRDPSGAVSGFMVQSGRVRNLHFERMTSAD